MNGQVQRQESSQPPVSRPNACNTVSGYIKAWTARYSGKFQKGSDKRIKTRFKAPCLSVTLYQKGWLGFTKTRQLVSCVDINRYGIAVVSPVPMGEGTQINLDFSGKYIKQSGVKGEVVSEVLSEEGYRLGIQFSYCIDDRIYSRDMDNALSRIEAMYRQRNANPAG